MQPAKVLLLESVAAQAAAARNALVGAGYRLVISRFEGDGFVKVREWKPDIVVLSNAYSSTNLTDFCRRLLDEGAGFRIVVASSLPLKRLLADEPELRTIAAAFVLRPYNPSKLRQTIDGLVSGKSTGGANMPDDQSLVGKRIFLAENDKATAAAVGEHLGPLGITVDHYSREGSDHGSGGRPDAIVVGWPAPRGFNLEVLKDLSAGGATPPLVVFSSESQETVKSRAPGLFNRTKMIFTKPVPWSHFTRFLARLLATPPAAPAAEGARPSQLDERGRLLRQIDEQAREIAEMKKRLFESGSRDTIAVIDARGAAGEKMQARVAELEKQIEMERAKHQFRETELDVKLSALLRKRSESEKAAQDLIDEGNDRAEDMQRALSEAHGEMHLLAEEVGSLKKDLEETLIAKEHAEEELHAGQTAIAKEKRALGEEKEKVAGDDQEVQKKLAEAQESLDTYKEWEVSLRRELKGHEEVIALKDEELERLGQEVRGAAGEKEKLQDYIGELEEKIAAAGQPREEGPDTAGLEKEIAELRNALEKSEDTVSALDGEIASWREKAAGAEASLADLAVREAELTELVDRKEQEGMALEQEASALREKVAALGARGKAEASKGDELQRLRETLGKKDSALDEIRGALARAEESKKELRFRAEELEREAGNRADEVETLNKALLAEREGRAQDEEASALREKVAAVEAGGEAEAGKDDELQRLRETLEEKDSSLDEVRGALARAEESEKAVRSRVEELEQEAANRADEVEELNGALLAEREKSEEFEKQSALLQQSVGGGSSAEETGRLEVSLAESERIRQELLQRVEALTADGTARERERDEARALLDESRRGAEELEGRMAALAESSPREAGPSAADLEEELAATRSRNDELQRRLEKESFDGSEREKEYQKRLQAADEEQGVLRGRIEDLIAEAATENEGFREAKTLLAGREAEAEETLRRIEELSRQLEETGEALTREREARRALQVSHDEKAASLHQEMKGQEALHLKMEEQSEELQRNFVALEAARNSATDMEEQIGALRRELSAAAAELEAAKNLDLQGEVEELQTRLAAALEGAEEARRESRDAEGIQKMLEEVTARAQAEIIEQSRKEVELLERLRTSVEEKKFLITRMEKELAGASERERRLSDLLEKSLKGSAQLAASLGRPIEPDNLPVAFVDRTRRSPKILPAIGAGAAALVIAGVVALAVYGLRDAKTTSAPVSYPEAAGAPKGEKARGGLSAQKEIWEDWSRSDVSGGVIFQATLRSPEEITAAVDAEKRVRGWSEERASTELGAQLEPYQFKENYYFHIYLKNLEPGYPSYVDNIYANLYLRDDQGREARAFLPADLEKYRRVYSFSSGELDKGRKELTYEVGIPIAFARGDLSPKPAFIELLAYNVGASSRRVLTWELR